MHEVDLVVEFFFLLFEGCGKIAILVYGQWGI